MLFVVVALASGGCRLFAPPSGPDRVDVLLDEASAETKQNMAAWKEAEAEFERRQVAAKAAIDAAAAYEVRAAEADAERARYDEALAEARAVADGCDVSRERLISLHTTLIEYVAEPRRDAAIAGLEPCRKRAAKPNKAALARELAAMRREVAVALERAFDTAHPDDRGHLVARVEGEVLAVEMPTYAGWDAARSQAEVDSWCAKIPNFTAVTLRNSQGNYRCTAAEPPKAYAARMLRVGGLSDPWVPPTAGTKRPPPPPGAADEAEIDRLSRDMQSATVQLEEASIKLDGAKERAEASIAHYEEMMRTAGR